MGIKEEVKSAARMGAFVLDIGIMDVVEKCEMYHPRVKKVWDAVDTKIDDVDKVLRSLGYKLEVVKDD